MDKTILIASLFVAVGASAQTATYPYATAPGYGDAAVQATTPAPSAPQPYVLPEKEYYRDFGAGRNSHEDYDWSYWTQARAGDKPGVHADGTVNTLGTFAK